MENKYLEEVVAQQADVQSKLAKKMLTPTPSRARRSRGSDAGALGDGAAEETAAPAIDVRITGMWPFRTVLVPPNAYVVHTRRGRDNPVTIGIGKSFRYTPRTDTFLVVPATTRTILIAASCICRERQGLFVQGYVQWIIEDFERAHRRLDFSDPVDPMRIVNTQLKEQAEATIKDTVATMSIDEVLSDKQPIIKVLTQRLREVSEGDGDQAGLGLSIVTVQIKEAVVSSARLWETLQRPFRAERAKDARLAELENDGLVRAREAEAQRQTEKLEIETRMESSALRAQAEREAFDREQTERQRRTKVELEAQAEAEQLQASAEAERFDREQAEVVRRAKLEAEKLGEAVAAHKTKLTLETELERLQLDGRLEVDERRSQAAAVVEEREIGLSARRQAVANDLSPAQIQAQLIDALPQVLEKLPQAQEQHNITVTADDHIGAVVGGIAELVQRINR